MSCANASVEGKVILRLEAAPSVTCKMLGLSLPKEISG